MGDSEQINTYSNKDEFLNVYSHGFGFLASLYGFFLLVNKSKQYDGFWETSSFILFGFSLLILYAASTLYHKAKRPKKRLRLKVFDHAAIFVLIAGI